MNTYIDTLEGVPVEITMRSRTLFLRPRAQPCSDQHPPPPPAAERKGVLLGSQGRRETGEAASKPQAYLRWRGARMPRYGPG